MLPSFTNLVFGAIASFPHITVSTVPIVLVFLSDNGNIFGFLGSTAGWTTKLSSRDSDEGKEHQLIRKIHQFTIIIRKESQISKFRDFWQFSLLLHRINFAKYTYEFHDEDCDVFLAKRECSCCVKMRQIGFDEKLRWPICLL